jgi:hypothetical protein
VPAPIRSLVRASFALAVVLFATAAQAAAPTITNLSPTVAVTGAAITVTGTNFCTTPASDVVKFNGTTATVNTATATSMNVTVPATATSGKVSVQTTCTGGGGPVNSTQDFYVVPSGYAANQVDQTNRLTLGTPQSVTVTSTHMAMMVFDTTSANQRIFFQWTGSTIAQMTITVKNPSGTFIVSSSTGTGSNYIDATTLATIGTYVVTIVPSGSYAGSLSFTAYNVPADVSGTTTPTAGGGVSNISITGPGQNAKYTFSGTAGRRVFLNLTASTLASGYAAILDQNGSPLAVTAFNTSGGYIDALTLPATSAAYSVAIDPTGANTGNITATLYDLGTADPAPTALASLPGSAAAAVTIPGETAGITFNGTANHHITIKVSGSTYTSASVWLKKPDGTMQGIATSIHAATAFLDFPSIPTTGLYTVVVDPAGAGTGTGTFAVYDVSDGLTPLNVSSTAPASLSSSFTISAPGQNWAFTFTGSVGERIAIAMTGSSLAGGGQLSLMRPDTTVVDTATISASSFLDTVALDQNGTFKLFFDPTGAATGTVNFTVYTVPADTSGTVTPQSTLGGGTAAATVTPFQNSKFTFSGTAGQHLAFKMGGTFIKSGTVTIYDPSMTQLGSSFTFTTAGKFADGYTATTTGTYTIIVDPTGSASGNVLLSAFLVPADVPGSTSPNGPAVSLTTTVPGQNMKVTFNGTVGHAEMVAVAPGAMTGTVKLYSTDGTTLLGSATTGTNGGTIDTTTLPATGTYTIYLDPKDAAVGTESVNVYDVPPDATAPISANGVAVSVTTTAPGQNITLNMNGMSAGQRIALQVSNPYSAGAIKVINPDLTQLVSKTFTSTGVFVDATSLTQSGNYIVKVDPGGTNFGSYTVTAWTLPLNPNLPITVGGAAVRLTTTTPGQNGTLTFTGSANAIVTLTMASVTEGTSTCCGAKITIQTPTATQLILAKSVGTKGGTLSVQLPADGTYTITMDPQSNAVGGITFTLA